MKNRLLIHSLKQKHGLWALIGLLIFDYRLHFLGPWYGRSWYPFTFGSPIDQSIKLFTLITLISSIFFESWRICFEVKSSSLTRKFFDQFSCALFLLALICWCMIAGLPFTEKSNIYADWVTRIALHLSTLTFGLPLYAISASAIHCGLCIHLWNRSNVRRSDSPALSPLQFLALAGLIVLGTNAFVGYASGSPLLNLEWSCQVATSSHFVQARA